MGLHRRRDQCCGHHTAVVALALALVGGAMGYFFGNGYWEADDDQVVFGALGICFVFGWGMMVRYANVPTRYREDLPWLVKHIERLTAWSAQCFLVFAASAIVNEKVLEPLVGCTNSRQSTPTIAATAFLAGSIALPEPTQVNSLIVNVLFLLSVSIRSYRDNSTVLYVLLVGGVGLFLLVIRWYADNTKVFIRRMQKAADVLEHRKIKRERGISKTVVRGYWPHVFWDICHHLNISWAAVFSLYYMSEGWASSLDLHERHYWIPLLAGAGGALLRFILVRMFWGRLKRELQLDAVSAGLSVGLGRGDHHHHHHDKDTAETDETGVVAETKEDKEEEQKEEEPDLEGVPSEEPPHWLKKWSRKAMDRFAKGRTTTRYTKVNDSPTQ